MIRADEIYERLVKAGDEWSDTNAAADLLEETRKILIAQLQTECPEKTVSAKEMYALSDERYENHVKIMVTARKTANRARVRWESARIYSELLRTQAATERQANKYGM